MTVVKENNIHVFLYLYNKTGILFSLRLEIILDVGFLLVNSTLVVKFGSPGMRCFSK